ncbi:MAG TPA: 1,4-alpha-glucan branching protein GlgB, partial [Bacilli bacterium]|nr:1,4-alpha-glucan branching protein GlgB [Bacilli bacterium]
YDFHNTYVTNAYEFLGCHLLEENKYVFRVYAPHADAVSVVGDFNHWDHSKNILKRLTKEGIWEGEITGITDFTNYKYWIKNKNKEIYKQDPYGFHHETNGSTCSKVYQLNSFSFSDEKWQKSKSHQKIYAGPINIYEVNLGSWRKYPDNEPFNYRKLARELIPYVKKMGYTHIEVMPIMEYPFGGSWGYQVTGYFSVTSRYGLPSDFMYFVNYAHKNGIGVILDWVPAHFPKDDFGLFEFDGQDVYEEPNPLRKEHENWGTRIFNYQKPEVKSFLISSALFFLEKYHLDGLRVDAVASMIYLDYDRKVFDKNIYGGNHHLEAIDFLKTLNTEVFKRFPFALMIAEESTDFAKVSHPVYLGGLGFNFKWNMGWMNDTLSYMQTEPIFRQYHHDKLTFSLMYAFSENFVLPISHDEVVHGKKSLLDKMPGNYDEKFANLRAFIGYMMTHPGKKLNFMGYEFGQFKEWDYRHELDWLLLTYEKHQKLHQFVQDINRLYKRQSCLWEIDYSWEGFQWINEHDKNHNCLSYERRNRRKKALIIIINFSGETLYHYRLGVKKGLYQELINSDDEKYGGNNQKNSLMRTEAVACHRSKSSIVLNVPAFSILILNKVGKE